MVLFIFSRGKPPFGKADATSDGLFKLIAKGKWNLFWKAYANYVPEPISEELKSLIEGMLNPDPSQRWSLE